MVGAPAAQPEHPVALARVAAVGEIALTANEYKTAQRLGDDYWLYVVFNCASKPEVTLIQNPARFDWEPLSKIDCYRIRAEALLTGSG